MKCHLFLLFCLFLTGCRSVSENKTYCPKTVIIAELLKTIELQEGVPLQTEIDGLTCSCTAGENQILMDLRLRFTSLRPLTLSRKSLTLSPSYFIAVVDGKGGLLSQTNHKVDLFFEEKKPSTVSFQHLLEVVPSSDAIVYIGFNLNEDQLRFLQEERHKKKQSFSKHTLPIDSKCNKRHGFANMYEYELKYDF